MTLSQKYHVIFDFKLVKSDYPKWQHAIDKSITGITSTKSSTRLKREQISRKKLLIAKKVAKILSKIPSVKFVGVTGSLAMLNASENSDIDLLIITSKNRLWLARLVILVLLVILHIPVRRAYKRDESNKLCLNMWLDENDLIWSKKDRNIYTSHEIAQIIPLVNKDSTYERFLYLNKWILDFWPNAIRISSRQLVESSMQKQKPLLHTTYYILRIFEKLAFNLQYLYMKRKMTREVITPTRALFHPTDWGVVVMEKLNSYKI